MDVSVGVLAREQQAPFAPVYFHILVFPGGEAGGGSAEVGSSAPGVAICLFYSSVVIQTVQRVVRNSGFMHAFQLSQVKEHVPQISGTILKLTSLNKCFEDAGYCRYVS